MKGEKQNEGKRSGRKVGGTEEDMEKEEKDGQT